VAIGLDQIAAVEPFGLGILVGIELGLEGRGLRVVGEIEVAGDAGVALLQASDRLVDLLGLDQFFLGDALVITGITVTVAFFPYYGASPATSGTRLRVGRLGNIENMQVSP